MRQILLYLGITYSAIYDYLHFSVLNKISRYLRTGFFARQMLHLGDKSSFEKNVRIVHPENIWMGDCVHVGNSCVLYTKKCSRISKESPLICIGNHVDIGDWCHITAVSGITICENVLIGKSVTITDNSHGLISESDIPPLKRQIASKGIVVIERNVWIGDKCTILPGVTIGEGSIIGANSVVTKSVPPHSVVVGIAAHIVSQKL